MRLVAAPHLSLYSSRIVGSITITVQDVPPVCLYMMTTVDLIGRTLMCWLISVLSIKFLTLYKHSLCGYCNDEMAGEHCSLLTIVISVMSDLSQR